MNEDRRAVNQPVVWLHNRKLINSYHHDRIDKFLNIVEIDESDPNLYLDHPFDELMQQVDDYLQTPVTEQWRWYFYTGSLPVMETRRWNGECYA